MGGVPTGEGIASDGLFEHPVTSASRPSCISSVKFFTAAPFFPKFEAWPGFTLFDSLEPVEKIPRTQERPVGTQAPSASSPPHALSTSLPNLTFFSLCFSLAASGAAKGKLSEQMRQQRVALRISPSRGIMLLTP